MKKFLFTLAFVSIATMTFAQGTIAFGNSALTRFLFLGRPCTLSDPSFNFGVFWGLTADSVSQTPVLPLGTSSTVTAGIIVAPSVYAIPGTEGGQIVYLQIRGWGSQFGSDWQAAKAAGWSAETDIRPVTLGPTAGPGSVIWQTATGVSPNRFYAVNTVRNLPLSS